MLEGHACVIASRHHDQRASAWSRNDDAFRSEHSSVTSAFLNEQDSVPGTQGGRDGGRCRLSWNILIKAANYWGKDCVMTDLQPRQATFPILICHIVNAVCSSQIDKQPCVRAQTTDQFSRFASVKASLFQVLLLTEIVKLRVSVN